MEIYTSYSRHIPTSSNFVIYNGTLALPIHDNPFVYLTIKDKFIIKHDLIDSPYSR